LIRAVLSGCIFFFCVMVSGGFQTPVKINKGGTRNINQRGTTKRPQDKYTSPPHDGV